MLCLDMYDKYAHDTQKPDPKIEFKKFQSSSIISANFNIKISCVDGKFRESRYGGIVTILDLFTLRTGKQIDNVTFNFVSF